MTHGRVPWYDPAALDPERRAVYDEIAGGPRAAGPQAFRLTGTGGRLEGPFNAMLTAPGVGGPLQRLGSAIRYATALPARWREIAILEVAVVRHSDFEWYAHERVGRAAGLTEEELTALRSGADAPSLTSAERTVRAVCRALLTDRDLDDEPYTRATADLGTERLYELLVLVGYYDLLALSLRTLRTPLPAGEPPVFG
ncbi:carboxymuconolactone decarboxylase family protein [Actinoallomurus iriomotensis]|uniref:4-carboxymuconolactone decarboxylase n=1 Tax=Actinoallomurus iriomotensis TaxID=478107 RepID=A0A9W6RSC5_9ACTN|nr:carboxymuconolactone decarboxylase family protein [Actinoallomurus iriomotensis]GLY79232.1 4-carboxymuconolactone decarboxylase [Actinoallomurus iriomotensis]